MHHDRNGRCTAQLWEHRAGACVSNPVTGAVDVDNFKLAEQWLADRGIDLRSC